jgi:anti-sigma factor RsiW
MNHLDEGTLQALLDGEISGGQKASVEDHLEACEHCQAELDTLREACSQLSGALRMLDRPAPVEFARRQMIRKRRWMTLGATHLRRAAVLLLVATTALSATIPGSPLREWVVETWRGSADHRADRQEATPPVTVAATEAANAPETSPAGVSVQPSDRPMRVVFRKPAQGLRVIAHLHDGSRVEVSAEGPAAKAHFRTAPDRIEIEAADTGEVRIGIPRSTNRFTLEVDGQVLLAKQGEDLRVPERTARSGGPVILLEVQP